jgi:hypothetical protein
MTEEAYLHGSDRALKSSCGLPRTLGDFRRGRAVAARQPSTFGHEFTEVTCLKSNPWLQVIRELRLISRNGFHEPG